MKPQDPPYEERTTEDSWRWSLEVKRELKNQSEGLEIHEREDLPRISDLVYTFKSYENMYY